MRVYEYRNDIEAIDGQIAQWQKDVSYSAAAQHLLQWRHIATGQRIKNKTVAPPEPGPAKATKRVMSAEGKARVAAAQRLRWEKQKKAATPPKAATDNPVSAAGKKAVSKKTSAKKTAAVEA